ncbi:DevR family CriSPR-associated autoregulator [groundwater metagenome]
MINATTLKPSKGLAITYLVRLSIASPSGGRSEIENLNVIKKIREGFLDFPYASSQAMKRALRDTMRGLGYSVSPMITSSPARTIADPIKYIDDDLFGFMDPSSKKEIKISEESESIDDVNKESNTEKINPIFLKVMVDKIKTKPIKEKIEQFFKDNPTVETLTFDDLKDKIQLKEKDIEKIKTSILKDDSAALNKMRQNINGVRKSVISTTPLLSLSAFDDSVDFGANMIGLKGGGSPMPYETEVHRGWYRMTLYIDLDRIGTGEGFLTNLSAVGNEKSSIPEAISQKDKDNKDIDFDFIQKSGEKFILIKKEYSLLKNEERYRRAKAILDSIRFLAPSGRSSNWLIDLTPKLIVAAYVKGARTPFLETLLLDEKQIDKNVINIKAIETAKETFADGIVTKDNNSCLVVGYRDDLIQSPIDSKKPLDSTNKPADSVNGIKVETMKTAFETIDGWLKQHFNIQDQKVDSTGQTQK